MRTPELLDISHHNPVADWDQVPDVPIVHKVNEGTAVDRRIRERLPNISSRHELFGGYTVLIASRSTIRQQIEQYAAIMEPFWRPGAFTQLDVEPWDQYDRPVTASEVIEAASVHDDIFGAQRCAIYINPNQLPRVFQDLESAGAFARWPLWLPDYSSDGREQAERRGAMLHQFTQRASVPGFPNPIDANSVLDSVRLWRTAGVDSTEPVEEESMELLQVRGDPAVYLAAGYCCRWVRDPTELEHVQQAFGLATPRQIERSDLAVYTLIGQQPQAPGVITGARDFHSTA